MSLLELVSSAVVRSWLRFCVAVISENKDCVEEGKQASLTNRFAVTVKKALVGGKESCSRVCIG